MLALKTLHPADLKQKAHLSFKMKGTRHNKGMSAFSRYEILFVLDQDRIDQAILMGPAGETLRLQVTERLEHGKIVLENTHGSVRMVLNASASSDEYQITINHPANTYELHS